MSRPRALDLFAGEGGSAYGLTLAGYDVTAVDDVDRPGRAPGVTWVTGDATTYPLDGFDLVTASPPCTDRTTQRTVAEPARGGPEGTGWMLPHTIERLTAWGGPWIVENVQGAARDMPGALKLCGSMFNLTDTTDGVTWLLRRHRLFLSNELLWAPRRCSCAGRPIMSVHGDLTANDRPDGKTGRRPNLRAGIDRARRLMGMPWATGRGLSLAIPPAYTRYLGELLLDRLPTREDPR